MQLQLLGDTLMMALSGRDVLWTAAVRATAEHPWFGVGPAGWTHWFSHQYVGADFILYDAFGNWYHQPPALLGGQAHSLWLTKSAEMGIPF